MSLTPQQLLDRPAGTTSLVIEIAQLKDALQAAEQRAERAERGKLDAYQQLQYLWETTGSCPCGARRESPNTHSHVTACPTAKAVELFAALDAAKGGGE